MAILGRERCPSLVEQYEQLAGVRGVAENAGLLGEIHVDDDDEEIWGIARDYQMEMFELGKRAVEWLETRGSSGFDEGSLWTVDRAGERLVLSLGGSTARRELVVGGGGNSFGERSNRELKMIGVRDELMIDHEWGVLVLARAITSSMISGGELCYWFEIELGGSVFDRRGFKFGVDGDGNLVLTGSWSIYGDSFYTVNDQVAYGDGRVERRLGVYVYDPVPDGSGVLVGSMSSPEISIDFSRGTISSVYRSGGEAVIYPPVLKLLRGQRTSEVMRFVAEYRWSLVRDGMGVLNFDKPRGMLFGEYVQ